MSQVLLISFALARCSLCFHRRIFTLIRTQQVDETRHLVKLFSPDRKTERKERPHFAGSERGGRERHKLSALRARVYIYIYTCKRRRGRGMNNNEISRDAREHLVGRLFVKRPLRCYLNDSRSSRAVPRRRNGAREGPHAWNADT